MTTMDRSIIIGAGTEGDLRVDLDQLFEMGLLIQANSGGGKSFLMRRLAEQLCALVPTFIVDVEGEFASLRESFPFFLAKKEGGDASADPAIAATLALKLRELRVSAVFDLFDLDVEDRHRWVANFLGALDTAPRDTWEDLAIIIDEAHVFAPEKGAGESVASKPMAALATRGRKRGLLTIAATQRLAKLNKDVAAELKNVMVGMTTIDIDRARARDALGVEKRERAAIDLTLRHLRPGSFLALGRAFGTDQRIPVKVGPVTSTHPERGRARRNTAPPPPPPEKIRELLAMIGDLPREAKEEASSAANQRADIARSRKDTAPAHPALVRQVYEERDRWRAEFRRVAGELEQLRAALDGATALEIRRLRTMEMRFDQVIAAIDGYRADGGEKYAKVDRGRQSWADGDLTQASSAAAGPTPRFEGQGSPAPEPAPRAPSGGDGDGAARMLRALAARHPTPLTEQQVSVLAGMKRTGGTYRTYRGKLTGAGLVVKDGQFLRITDVGLKQAGKVERPTSGAELLAMWRPRFTGKARDLLELFAHNGRLYVAKADALRRIGLDPAGGTARTYWGQINGCGLIERGPGGFRAVESLVVR